MAEEKVKVSESPKKKLSYDFEVALLGLMLVIVSLIGLLNQGYLGSFITYCFVFMLGTWYYFVSISLIFIGMYLLIKHKKPKYMTALSTIAFVLLIVTLAIASSKNDYPNWFTNYKSSFEIVTEGTNHVNIGKINNVGGGLIGYSLYALLSRILTVPITIFLIVALVLLFGYFAFRDFVIEVYQFISKAVEKNREKKKEKIKEAIAKQESNNEIENITVKKKETSHFLTYDIFTEKIFDEPEVTIEQSNVSAYEVETNEFERKDSIEQEAYSLNGVQNAANTEPASNEGQYQSNESNIEPDEESALPYQDNVFEYEDTSSSSANVNNVEIKEETIVSEPEIIRHELFPRKEESSVEAYVDQPVRVEQNEITAEPKIKVGVTSEETPKPKVRLVSDLYTLLDDGQGEKLSEELIQEVENNCVKINQKLEELNIKAKVTDYIIGPSVTRYEIVPEIGVRVSSIVNIQNDLKLALAAVNLRMEAPIPGKSAVGIEVANKKRYPVSLKEVLTSIRNTEGKLLVAIGKDLSNNPVTLSIDKMPHLLIAGTTGSGKSVCINAIIISLIMRATPDEVKIILVDPKKVEMMAFAELPHLLCPIVTDPKKANNALKKVVIEMDKRYDLFASNGVKNIDGYNKLVGVKPLPKIVVIIDELADLMQLASKEVEESIQRITQLARAAGIHLIVATQRPSVNVITGVIKANIPSRIAFTVSSMVDSRTILDRAGAEDLLGRGDMLLDISGSGFLNRVQGVFVTDEEIKSIVEQINSKYEVDFNEDFLNLEDDKKEVINNLSEPGENSGEDELYYDIRSFVIQNQKASTSLLQRYFSLGYARAARMMDRLEAEGVVSSSNGIKPREVLIKEDDVNNGSSGEENQ